MESREKEAEEGEMFNKGYGELAGWLTSRETERVLLLASSHTRSTVEVGGAILITSLQHPLQRHSNN